MKVKLVGYRRDIFTADRGRLEEDLTVYLNCERDVYICLYEGI